MARFVSSTKLWLGYLIWLWTQRISSVVQSFQISPGIGVLDILRRPLLQPALHRNYFHTTQKLINYQRTIALYSQTDDDVSADDANDSSPPSPLSFRQLDDFKITDQQQQKEENPILMGVAQAKVSGIFCIATLLSQGAYARGGGDISSLDGVLGLPPGGPIVVMVGTVSGMYTLWRIQPVLAAVRASVDAQDERMRLSREQNDNTS